jgi:hypothetical protein
MHTVLAFVENRCLTLLGFLLTEALMTPCVRAEDFQAGFATADITPPTGWRRAGGYSEVVSTGVHDPLWSKAIVLSQSNITIAFVRNDLCSVPRELTDRARRRASEKTGIPFAHIVIAATIKQAVTYARSIVTGQLAIRSITVQSPVVPVSEAEYAAAHRIMETPDHNGARFLEVVDAWRKIFRHECWQKYQGKLPQEVQAIRLDRDTAVVTLPHEVFVELGMGIKSASPFRTTIIISLANDLDFYIPTRRAFEEGHYEPTPARWSRVAASGWSRRR